MGIFISWSGKRSKIFAEYFYDFVKEVLPPIDLWMSDKKIKKGDRWNDQIRSKFSEGTIGIICVTPENQTSSWLLFESGAISTLKKSKVCPILLGLDQQDLIEPLNQFQVTSLDETDLFKLIIVLNESLGKLKVDESILKEKFDALWESFSDNVSKKMDGVRLGNASERLPSILKTLQNYGISKPNFGTIIQFKDGFETHSMYEALLNIANERIYFFGRKNRKLFDKDHSWFFDRLSDRQKENFDFRCLFLNPESPRSILASAHKDEDFADQLQMALKSATSTLLKYNINPEICLRMYNFQRNFEIVVIDDVVLFSPVIYSHTGTADRLTRSPFSITTVDTFYGAEMLKYFIDSWEVSETVSL